MLVGEGGSYSLWQWSFIRLEPTKEDQPGSGPTENSLTPNPWGWGWVCDLEQGEGSRTDPGGHSI